MKKVKVEVEVEVEKSSKRCLNLNSDIIIDILSRVPVKQLLGMKCISKEWCRIISSRSFIKAHHQHFQKDKEEEEEEDFKGFVLQEKFRWCTQDIKTITYVPVVASTSSSTNTTFHQNVFTFLPEQVVVLASCKGIFCCRTCLPSDSQPTIYVCNPTTRDWIQLDELPPPPCQITESIGLAFDFDFDHQPSNLLDFHISPKFKFNLVRLKQVEIKLRDDDYEEELEEDDDRDFLFTFDLYSSETRTWRKSSEICKCNRKLVKNKCIYIGGILHWLTDGDQILSFDVEKELCWLISVPVPAAEFRTVPESCIGESDGKLHYVQVSEEGIQVWYLEDYFEFKWTLKHCKPLEELEKDYPNFFFNLKNRVSMGGRLSTVDTIAWMNPLAFKDGVLLIKVCRYLYMYHIKITKMVQACDFLQLNPKSMSHPTVFPLSLSLLPLN